MKVSVDTAMATPGIIRPDNHPFPFLLHLEWVLLGVAVLSELTPAPVPRHTAGPVVAIAALLLFGALGLRLPTRSWGGRVLHLAGQLVLILLASQAGLAGLRLFPFLYLILLIRSCLMLAMVGRVAVLCSSFLMFAGVLQVRVRALAERLPPRAGRGLFPLIAGIQVNLLFLFGVLMVFVLFMVNALLAERQRREQLRQANDKLRESTAQIEALAMAQERSRIAREIHDSLGHSLTALNIQLESAVKLWQGDPIQSHDFLLQAKTMGTTALEDVRRAVATLRTHPLQATSLSEAIAQLTQQFTESTGITPRTQVSTPALPSHLQVAVYRIVQEALTNIARHAQASAVDIFVQPVPFAQGGGLSVTVRDDGQGFFLEDNSTGFGLKGMRERTEAEGGRFQLISAPGQGCTIQVWLPGTHWQA
jgi:signal transduction histidine kinase